MRGSWWEKWGKHIYFSKLQMMNMLHIFNLGIRKEHLFVLLGKKTVTDADSAQPRTHLQTVPLVLIDSASRPEDVPWTGGTCVQGCKEINTPGSTFNRRGAGVCR